jgi:DNA gyrase/topoisomerase IV subunit A
MVSIKEVFEQDDVVIVTTRGKIIRQHASEIRLAGRNTQGVRLIRLEEGDSVSDVGAVSPEEDEPKGPGGENGSPPAGGPRGAAQGSPSEKKNRTVDRKTDSTRPVLAAREKPAQNTGGKAPQRGTKNARVPAAQGAPGRAQASGRSERLKKKGGTRKAPARNNLRHRRERGTRGFSGPAHASGRGKGRKGNRR